MAPKLIVGTNDLKTLRPQLVEEWDYFENGDLKPEDISVYSNKEVTWKCKRGHKWRAKICNRSNGRGCPYCNNKKVLRGYNDLQTIKPELAKEWHYKKNKELKPHDVVRGSNKTVWWLCENGHEWKSRVVDRMKGHRCPQCIGKVCIEGINDLKSINQQLSEEWNYVKNGSLRPENVMVSSRKSVWWKCKEGHEWQATICNRSQGRNCPICSGKKVMAGYNDLKSTNPRLSGEWNYVKNVNLTPEMVVPHSNKKVWWICNEAGHEWQATVKDRAYGYGCPHCSGRKVVLGENDLPTLYPLIAEEWDYEKDCSIKPNNIGTKSSRKVWWKCKEGHEWQATVKSRIYGRGCPHCSGRYPIEGINDLKTINPELAEEWNFEKNQDLLPEKVSAYSNKKVWWKCSVGHEWQAKVNNRSRGCKCPICRGRGIYENS